jgi:hypothetical protein
MRVEHQTWRVRQLLALYQEGKLLLNPPYQRNAIWSASAQRELIATILNGWPIPSFFILNRDDGVCEVVDGQQRARTIIGFHAGQITAKDGIHFDEMPDAAEAFLDYVLNVTRITDLRVDESIQKFYALVNSSGLRLNRPEIRKAEFYTTNLLRLVTTVAALPDFQHLGLFTRLSSQRMNDIEFVAELIGQLQFGTMDKKDKIDEMFEADIGELEYGKFFSEFIRIVKILVAFDTTVPFSRTRYRQKNDFYTLFGFIHAHPELSDATLRESYRILVKIGPYIRPSQDRCEVLMEYAMNCVTQSNSKKARDSRQHFINDLLINATDTPTAIQQGILQFFGAGNSAMRKVDGLLLIDAAQLKDPDSAELTLL